jgi:adenine-specific DNA-methyltransferase
MDPYVFQPMFTYLGNKRKLIANIEQVVETVKARLGLPALKTLDGFTGSTVVARMLAKHSSEIHTNDLEYYSLIAAKCFLERPTAEQEARVRAHIERMNALYPTVTGIVTDMYAPRDTENVQPGERCFFTHENAMRIDTWRRYIADHVEPDVFHWCLCPILIQMALKANTYGHFKAFSKNDGVGTFQRCGDRVKEAMVLEVPIFNPNSCQVSCHQLSTNDLLKQIPEGSLDLVYLDPPYNEHEYAAFYFLHNVVARNERPTNVNVTTGLPKVRHKSDYNHKTKAVEAMRDLIDRCVRVAKYTLVSYNDEGLVPLADWNAILEPYNVERIDIPYSRYAANSKKDDGGRKEVVEFLYLISSKNEAPPV